VKKEHSNTETTWLEEIKATVKQIFSTPGTVWIMMFVIVYKLGKLWEG
jgi:uncharacterized protein YqfB (UPF0267 family)